ncbi:MAG: 50S ribosomal protein L21 [Bacteroidales bacterium]|jgi:large subunit ribosomal protein L21|nr:50S ribosomal protein L21 [Bacteroidales bacterium]
MYAIVEIAGQQFKVEEGKKIFVHHLDAEKDAILEFDRVLLLEDNDKVLVGEPTIANYVVEGKVLDHVRGDKVIVFKKKRKKGYRVKNGHRQNFSQLEIIGIGEKGSVVRKETVKKVKAKAADPVAAEEPAEEKTGTVKKASARKTTAKKEEAASNPAKAESKKAVEKKPAAKKASKKKE